MRYLIVVCCFLMFSCGASKGVITQPRKQKLLTHRQVMDSFRTKKDLEDRLGKPDDVDADDVFEYWYYKFGTLYKGVTLHSGNMSFTRIIEDGHYLKFTIDADGNVYKWKSHGVNMRERRAK